MARSTLRVRIHEPQRHPAEDALAFALGIALGALAGAVAAILLAPSDGETMRRRVKQTLGMEPADDDAAPFGAHTGSAGAGDPFLAPRDVATEERVVDHRVTAGAH